jgi:8-oxo-dGTP diphosphatase
MKRYVEGFLFSPDYKEVVLIQKHHPYWMRGKLNGVGGVINRGETEFAAMKREFQEEAGMLVSDWNQFLIIAAGNYQIHYFRATGDVTQAHTRCDLEPVRIYKTLYLHEERCIPDLAWIIPLAMIELTGSANLNRTPCRSSRAIS